LLCDLLYDLSPHLQINRVIHILLFAENEKSPASEEARQHAGIPEYIYDHVTNERETKAIEKLNKLFVKSLKQADMYNLVVVRPSW
jgi:hypothetical protein